uniref:Uncharacterized protein n=1 Tax=Glossina pallidipes TaxID=7398 RepID=A0A1B0A6P2_GLOPL
MQSSEKMTRLHIRIHAHTSMTISIICSATALVTVTQVREKEIAIENCLKYLIAFVIFVAFVWAIITLLPRLYGILVAINCLHNTVTSSLEKVSLVSRSWALEPASQSWLGSQAEKSVKLFGFVKLII